MAHVEGRVALRFHGVEDAGLTSTILTGLLNNTDEWVDEGLVGEDFLVEIVALDLTQVQVAATD